jgi:hypothetical protein
MKKTKYQYARKQVSVSEEVHALLVKLCRMHNYKLQGMADWILKEYLTKQEMQ